ncbi:cutinase family protein [Gordonia sp. ABSL49_1]|uniref:cutinase family protein n=1 Tax=unclassified Gordonia (in: high G+C Gram-positive bacteria) TaxID=2657482 RepID=UPI001F112FFB|nr:cutinase family protein [Gordonia sp. ABSL49_1]MCH5643331.1 cutinase family protein [Gordonia sp. ABSL49_1]
MRQMIKRLLLVISGLTMAIGGSIVVADAPAMAAPCADVEVVFARGTVESAPPVGLTGLSFGAALRQRLPGKSVNVYGVNYPASDKFNNRLLFAQTVANGVRDAQNRVKYIAATCPRTRIVLGGYSQGAVVAGYAVQANIEVPARYRQYADRAPKPLPASLSKNIAAVVLFGPPSDRFIRDVGAPPIRIAPAYRYKTVRYCIPADTICNGSPVGGPNVFHVLYAVNGMTVDAANYVARRL